MKFKKEIPLRRMSETLILSLPEGDQMLATTFISAHPRVALRTLILQTELEWELTVVESLTDDTFYNKILPLRAFRTSSTYFLYCCWLCSCCNCCCCCLWMRRRHCCVHRWRLLLRRRRWHCLCWYEWRLLDNNRSLLLLLLKSQRARCYCFDLHLLLFDLLFPSSCPD